MSNHSPCTSRFNYRVWAETSGAENAARRTHCRYDPAPHRPRRWVQAGLRGSASSSPWRASTRTPTAKPTLGSKPTTPLRSATTSLLTAIATAPVDGGLISTTNGYQDGGSDLRAEVTAPMTFDRVYDLTKAPNASPDQIKAAVTQLFYMTNWLHDYWYDSGFNEAAGNAQQSNYGRGGAEGDPLLAEAQDAPTRASRTTPT